MRLSRRDAKGLVLGAVAFSGVAAVLICLSLWPRPAADGGADRHPRQPDAQTGEMAELLMTACEQGQFFGGPVRYEGGGWQMTLPDGSEIDRNGLQVIFAAPVIRLGPEAVPHLFKWVMHENLAVRYVAMYSLEQITGIRADIGWFDREDTDHHREKAIARWSRWWETWGRDEAR